MKEHPFIFSAPMVRAILDGRKSQTRRIVKPKYEIGMWDWDPKDKSYGPFIADEYGDYHKVTDYAPWQPGDKLWVRETFAMISDWTVVDPDVGMPDGYIYRADWEWAEHPKWKPAIHMPRAASRITLEVVNVRAERVQDISAGDARAEGIPEPYVASETGYETEMRGQFRDLWDSLNAKKGYGWNNNPWVWVIEFRRVDYDRL